MPRRAAGLTAARVKAEARPGRYGDGGNLYLVVRSAEAKFWTLRYRLPGGRAREAGLGPATGPDAVGLAEARQRAAEARKLLRAGFDPLAEKQARAVERVAAGMTFRDVAALYVGAHAAGWRNPKHGAQWQSTLAAYAHPYIGDLPAAVVTTAHVMAALEPIWREKPETASRVRGRIEAVLDYATAQGWRTGENPARWRGHLANLLPKRSKVARVEHHPAVPWRQMPAVMAKLADAGGMSALALRFLILTAARSSEARGATWAEIDMTAAVWTVPAERMKAGRQHRVPLSAAALDVLRLVLPLRDRRHGDLVFPGGRLGRPLSDVALSKALGRPDATVHGFRSTFRDWCAEQTDYPGDLAEAALAHVSGDKVEAAYRRSDLFEKRRSLMAEWAAFATRAVPQDEILSHGVRQ